MQIFRAEVLDTSHLTDGMIRIVFGGGGLKDFTSTGVGDEYLRVFLPEPGSKEPVLPFAAGDYWDYAPGVQPSPMRTYTVRAVDPDAGTVTIDFVVHDGGVAASWARAAVPGDAVGLNSPTGLYDPPAGLGWQVLLTDATGLPAVGRLIEQAPAGVRTRVVIEIAQDSHRQEFAPHPDVEITWILGGNGHSQSALFEVIRSMDLPGGTGYIWFAGESKVLRSIRKHLRHERALAPASYKLIGYWTDKLEQWEERWENLEAGTKAELDALWADDSRDPELIQDDYHNAMESLGL